MLPDPEVLADVVVQTIETVLGPVLERLAVAEAQLAAIDKRVQDDSLTKELGTLRERVAVVEVKALQPGPPGEPGKDGKDGKDGVPGLTYHGVFQDGKSYQKGDVVTWAGQMFHCHTDETTAKPEEFGPHWQLCVKRGRDGKDAK